MAEPYSGLEVAYSEHANQSPEVINHSTFAPQRASLSHDSPEVVSEPTFAADVKNSSPSDDKPEIDREQWAPQVRSLILHELPSLRHHSSRPHLISRLSAAQV